MYLHLCSISGDCGDKMIPSEDISRTDICT